MFHLANTIHNLIEPCSHLITRIPDIRISLITKITKATFSSKAIVKYFFTYTLYLSRNSCNFRSNSTSSIRYVFVNTSFCFLNSRFHFLDISFCVIDFVPHRNCSSTKTTTY